MGVPRDSGVAKGGGTIRTQNEGCLPRPHHYQFSQ